MLTKVSIMNNFDMNNSVHKKRKVKHFLKPIGKFALYGPIVSLLAAGTLKVVGDTQLENYYKENEVDEAITLAERIIGDNTDHLTVSRLEESGKYSYEFNVSEVLTSLKESKDIFNNYKSEHFLSDEEEKEYENSMDTILYCNDKLIEIYNEIVKRDIAKQINVSPKDLDITYNQPNDTSEPQISVTIDGKPLNIGLNLKQLIKSYKQGLMLTYDPIIFDTPNSAKKYKVQRVLDNIPNLRKVVKKLNSPRAGFIVAIENSQPKANHENVNSEENANYDFSTNPSEPIKIALLEVSIPNEENTSKDINDEER